jgi:phage/plasmid primase-like uncharacterized protein
MSHKTFIEQIESHRNFLHQSGLDVQDLQIGTDFVRCHAIGENQQGRGNYAYKISKNPMDKLPGLVGLITWCRGPGGQHQHKTYGHDGQIDVHTLNETPVTQSPTKKEGMPAKEFIDKCRYLWDQAKPNGRSDYLERKGAGAYGIRFKENQYGRVALVPACDARGILLAIQFLNQDGSKRFLEGSQTAGLFHMLREPINGQDIGIAESYVTAATCMEITGITCICCFSCDNIKAVLSALVVKYPESRFIIFADNDRHLEIRGLQNQGVLKARQARDAFKDRITLAIPDFDDCEPSKEASDWNDLVRIKGDDHAKAQIDQSFFMYG